MTEKISSDVAAQLSRVSWRQRQRRGTSFLSGAERWRSPAAGSGCEGRDWV